MAGKTTAKTTAAPAAVATSTQDDGRDYEGVYIRSVSERRCRAGLCFDQEGQGFAKGVLTDEQLAALEADPLLNVEHGTFSNGAE